MTFYSASAIVNFLTCIVLTVFVYRKNPDDRTNKSFALFSFLSAAWSLAYFFWQVSADSASALFWTRMLMAFAALIPVAYLHFILHFSKKFEQHKRILIGSYVLFSLFIIADFTPYFVSRVEPTLLFPFWPKPGVLFHPFLALWFAYVAYAGYILYQTYLTTSGLLRSQSRYILIGMLIGFLGGSTNYLLWYNIPIAPVGNIFVSVYVGILAYAIIRYRLMDIRVVGRRVYMYAGIGFFVYAMFYFLAWLHITAFGGIFTRTSFFAGALIAPLFVFLMYRIIAFLEKIANTYLFSELYAYQAAIESLAEQLNRSIDIKDMARMIVHTLKDVLKVERVAFVSVKNGIFFGIEENSGFAQDALSQMTGVARMVAKEKRIISKDELLVKPAGGNDKIALTWDALGLELCVPLQSGNRLVGLVLLGAKTENEAFNSEDIHLLTSFSYQAGIAVDNARLYEEIKSFNKTLQKKVDEQTKDIQAKADNLERLLKMKSEFIDVVSHQLRTPVSVIKGMASMLKDGDLENAPKEQREEFAQGIFEKSNKLADILNDFLRAEELDAEDFKFVPANLKKVRLEELVQSVCNDLKNLALDKKIDLVFNAPATPTNFINTDPRYCPQAISNLIDNAIKYTQQGSVTVSVRQEGANAICEIKDTGIGIPKADFQRLFEKFVRAKNAVDAYAYGTGLGLFIAKKIVEAHPGGKIVFESEEGKGTMFKILIPTV